MHMLGGGSLPYSRSLCRYATLLNMGHAHGVPMKAKMWLKESHYRRHDTNTFQKKRAETWLDNMRKGMWLDSSAAVCGEECCVGGKLGGEWPASRLTFASSGKFWCSGQLCRLASPKFSTKWRKDEPVLRLGRKRRGLGTIGIDLTIPLWVSLSHVEQKL